MYKAYEAKNDNPGLRSFMYISLCVAFIAFVIIIFTEKILNLLGIITGNLLPEMNPWLFRISTLLLTSVYSFFVFSRRDIKYYESLFENKEWLNTHIKIWMLILFPFVVLFGGTFLLVPLFGGEIMGEKIIGLFYR